MKRESHRDSQINNVFTQPGVNFGLREPLCQRPLSSNELHAAFGARVIGREDASTSVGALGLGGP